MIDVQHVSPGQVAADPFKKKHGRDLVIMAIILLVCAAIVFSIFSRMSSAGAFGDSGVTACQQIVANKKAAVNTPDDKMTVTQWEAKKSLFTKSHFADLRVAGSNVIDMVYAMDNDINVDLEQSYADMTKIEALWGNLQIACSSHGVNIPGLG